MTEGPTTDNLRPVAKPRLYEQVIASLRDHVAGAGLRAGDRLPPERELAARLGVSRTSVRQAIVALEVQGLVEVRHGGGLYLRRDGLDAAPGPALPGPERRQSDVLDARDALETKLAELAAIRRTEADLAAIEAALTALADAIGRGAPVEHADQRFHDAVTTAAHSPVLAAFLTPIAGQIRESRRAARNQPGGPARLLAAYRAVAAAINTGDPTAAAAATRHHMHAAPHDPGPPIAAHDHGPGPAPNDDGPGPDVARRDDGPGPGVAPRDDAPAVAAHDHVHGVAPPRPRARCGRAAPRARSR